LSGTKPTFDSTSQRTSSPENFGQAVRMSYARDGSLTVETTALAVVAQLVGLKLAQAVGRSESGPK
jgi:hypothetical protein